MIRYCDVSLTDGQSARWAGGMSTPMALAVVMSLWATRPAAIEVASPAVLQQCLTRGEDPWQRIDLLGRLLTGIPRRASVSLLTEHGSRRGVDVVPLSTATQWLQMLAVRDVTEVVLIDPLLDIGRIAPVLDAAKAFGITTIAALPFVAEYSDAVLQWQAATLAAAGADRVMLRDEAGLLTVDRLATLLPALRAALGATALDLHLRCQTALGPLVAIEAVRLGVDGLDTAFAPLANGASAPALGTLLKSLRLLKLGTPVTEQRLHAIGQADQALAELADRHGFEPARAWVFDLAPYTHQLPGEVAAQVMQTLAELGLQHKLHPFANECACVRRDLGSPPMVAPFARAIAEQALLHLQGAPRYVEIRPGVRRALQQIYGKPTGAVDGGLQRRVGALARHAAAPTEAPLLTQVCGVLPEALPVPSSADDLRYVPSSPAEVLIAGLTNRAARYAQVGVNGPGVEIQVHGSGD